MEKQNWTVQVNAKLMVVLRSEKMMKLNKQNKNKTKKHTKIYMIQ